MQAVYPVPEMYLVAQAVAEVVFPSGQYDPSGHMVQAVAELL